MKTVSDAFRELGQHLLTLACELSPDAEAPVKPARKGVTLDEVRSVLAGLSRSGMYAEMRAVLKSFGASRLSDVQPERYADLLKAAQAIRDRTSTEADHEAL